VKQDDIAAGLLLALFLVLAAAFAWQWYQRPLYHATSHILIERNTSVATTEPPRPSPRPRP
jgi:uncharacterized protein involved in exopolysaccharide biosynthesis